MYRVLIADDEAIIRKGIAKFLSKDAEVEVVAQAEDGEMALALAREHHPDLIFVDINMPFLNGLQFIEKLKAEQSDVMIIVVTGYDDFNYAQQALHIGVFDYLLKPIMEETFYAALDKAKKNMFRRYQDMRYLEWARMQLQRNKPHLIAEFLEGWLDGRFSDIEVDERAGYLGFGLPEQPGVTLVNLFGGEGRADPAEGWNDDLIFYAAENIALEVYASLAPVSSCRNGSGELVLISSRLPQGEWDQAGARLKDLLDQHLPVEAVLTRCCGEHRQSLPEVYSRALSEQGENARCPQMVKDVKQHIEEHYADSGFSLQEAADFAHVSPQYLSRIFRHETGVTFMDCITRTRIRRAIGLLALPDLKMYEIAERVGYSTQHYFSSAFKRVLGVSPMEYRKNCRL